MCQSEVVNYLKRKRGKEVSIVELMAVIPVGRPAITRSCRRLVDFKEIRVRKIKTGPSVKHLFSI